MTVTKNKSELSYNQSISELEEIIAKMENGEMDIDELSAKVARASLLIKACKDKLQKTNAAVDKLMKDLEKES